MIFGESMSGHEKRNRAGMAARIGAVVAAALGGGAAWAVNDMPGGPGVN